MGRSPRPIGGLDASEQANSDDDARKLRLQNAEASALEKLQQKSMKAEAAALAEAAKDEAQEKHNQIMRMIEDQ